MKIEIIGGDPATQKAVQDKLAGRGFTADITAAGHTPGPWRIDRNQVEGAISISADAGYRIADCYAQSNADYEANARLIASAPELASECVALRSEKRELLAALASLLKFTDAIRHRESGDNVETAAARTAIAKAQKGVA